MDCTSGKPKQAYYAEIIEELNVLAEVFGKLLDELQNRLGVVLSPASEGELPKNPEPKTISPGSHLFTTTCELDERLTRLVATFNVRRDNLKSILQRIQL